MIYEIIWYGLEEKIRDFAKFCATCTLGLFAVFSVSVGLCVIRIQDVFA